MCGLHEFHKALFGLGAIEEYVRDVRMLLKERHEIVWDLLLYMRIEAAPTYARCELIP